MELQQGSKRAYPDELIHVSDSGGARAANVNYNQINSNHN
ncbi:hypothetical protein YPS_0069 [Yersinia pestis Pestoides A]|nr:hypothetical protein YPS_0069 [Yersinia pestis Pestoides A]